MIKISQSAAFMWPVVVEVPSDGGKFIKHTFDVEFKRMTASELDSCSSKISAGDLQGDEMVRDIVVGWKGVQDGGEEVPFSASALDQLLEIPGVAAAIVHAYTEAMVGGAARRKN